MTGTTMVAFKSAFLTKIRAQVSEAGLSIGYGDKPDGTTRSIRIHEAVTTEGGEGVTPVGFRGGRTRMQETYTVRVVCESIGKPTPLDAETDVVALGAHVEDAMWALIIPPDARPAGVTDAVVTGRALKTDEAGGTRSVFELFITVKARTL